LPLAVNLLARTHARTHIVVLMAAILGAVVFLKIFDVDIHDLEPTDMGMYGNFDIVGPSHLDITRHAPCHELCLALLLLRALIDA